MTPPLAVPPLAVPPLTLPEPERSPDDAPLGGLSTARGHLPLVALDVAADVTGLLATTKVTQTFVNTLDEAIEATYIFPLPDRAAVTSFVATLADRRIVGLLKERQQARDDYDAAIAAGQRAALLEEDRPGVFSAKVGNLRPGEAAVVELTLAGPLPYDDGEATFRFPLVVAPRYIPGVPLPGAGVGDGTALDTDLVPDASRISPPVLLPGHPNPVRLSIEVVVDPAGLALSDLRSSLHAVTEEAATGPSGDTGAGAVRVSVRPGERLDCDFVLRFRLAGAAPSTAAVMVPDAPGAGEGTLAVTVVPPVGTATSTPRDVAVVLDRSGSMHGWKMVAARRAAARVVDTLVASDRLAVFAFDDRIDRPSRLATGLVAATDRNRFAAVEFLAGVEARGGTEMHRPLAEAAALLAAGDQGRDRVLVLVTDGQIGHEDHVLRELARSLAGTRVFSVGIDQAVNAGFLHRLGEAELVESEDRLDEAMDRIQRRIAPPLATGLRLWAAGGIELLAGTFAPARPADCFPGSPVVISARYRTLDPSPARVMVGSDPMVFAEDPVDVAVVANPAVRATWARARVRELEDRYVVAPEDALAARIVATSLAHGVVSRFTAFVAVDPTRSDDDPGRPHSIVQPVELPAGWAAQPMAAAGAPLRTMRLLSKMTPMSAPMPDLMSGPMPAPPATSAAEAAAPDWRAVWKQATELLRRLEDGAATAEEAEDLLARLEAAGAPDALIVAMKALVDGLRAAPADAEPGRRRRLVAAARKAARHRAAFWR